MSQPITLPLEPLQDFADAADAVAFVPHMGRSHKRSKKEKRAYNRTSAKNKRQGTLRGGSFSAKYAAPFVHRSIFVTPQLTWPFHTGNPQLGLTGLRTLVPEKTWGQYTRGFDSPQVTSNGIRSRNCTMNVSIQFPKAGAAAQPYRFRVVQCWVKSPMIGYQQSSTQGTSSMADGIVLNYEPDTAIEEHTHKVFSDSIGVINGDGMSTGNISSDRIKVISDRTIQVASTNVDGAGAFVYPTFTNTYNFNSSTSGAVLPIDPLNIKMVPLNNPNLWIPTVAMMVLNGQDYTGATDQPKIRMTESHYWTNC